MGYTRTQIADAIVARLTTEKAQLHDHFAAQPVRYCSIDQVLPYEVAVEICKRFPEPRNMVLKKSLRERKFVTAQMDLHDPLLEEAIFAFQDPRVVDLIAEITGILAPEPDGQLYAGGLSLMTHGHFLNPHIDNSHDRSRQRYRVLNLLYYVSPGWGDKHGGNLEVWPHGPTGTQVTIPSLFNRLVIMETNRSSWHSVSPVCVKDAERHCVSNYYFSKHPPEGTEDYFHITSFRGRPEQPVRDLVLRGDIALRSFLRKLRPMGVAQNRHYYQGK